MQSFLYCSPMQRKYVTKAKGLMIWRYIFDQIMQVTIQHITQAQQNVDIQPL